MDKIKSESVDVVCRGCLSRDRRLSPEPYYDVYFSLLDEKQRTEVLRKSYNIAVCWECTAILKKFQSFQAQIRRAHTILEDSLTTPTKDSLSHLTIRVKDKYDACYEDSKELQRIPNLGAPSDIKHETLPVEINESNTNQIKVEKSLNDSTVESNVSTKKRKAKTKNVKTKKRRKGSEIDIDLKADVISQKNKESKKEKTKKGIEIEICNVNIVNSNVNEVTDEKLEVNELRDEKVEVKVEYQSDNNDDYWTQESAFVDESPPIKKKKKHDSDSEYSYKEKEKKGEKKRIFNFKKVIVEYDSDYLRYFDEIEMSEDEIRRVLEKQPKILNKSKPYCCEFCGACFKQKKTLDGHVSHRHRKDKHKDHIKQEEPDSVTPSHSLFRCSWCNRMLRKEHTQSHLNECHKHKYYCLGCPWSEAFFWNKDDHAQHWQNVHSQAECDLCRQTRRNTHDMERHMRASHLPMKCPQCPRVYSKWKYYRAHQKLAHPVLAQEPPESRYCVECDLQFPSIMAYKMHVMNQHRNTPKKRWPCPACDKTLNNKDTMKKHYARFHSDKTKYQCERCGKYLSSKCALQHHMNSHFNIKLPKNKLCSVCGRGFSTKRMLRFHTYTHTGERPYACAHCPAAFTQPNPLRVHTRKQHPLLHEGGKL